MKRLGIVACVALACGTPVARAAPESLTILVDSVSGAPGQDLEVPIRMKGARDLGALQFRLSFDPTVLEASKVEPGEATADAGMEPSIGSDGRIGLGFYTLKALSGEGVIFKVLVRVRGAVGQKIPLKLDVARAWDEANTAEMLVTTQDGEFTVISAPWRIELWWIAAAAGGLFLMLMIIWLSRRKSRSPQSRAVADEIPTYGRELTFKHHCSGCQQVIELPQSAIGKPFKCAGCGETQIGGR